MSQSFSLSVLETLKFATFNSVTGEEYVTPGVIEVSGLDIPITHHAPMGMIYSVVRRQFYSEHGVSVVMVMLNRRLKSTDPFRMQFLLDYGPVDELRDNMNRLERLSRDPKESLENARKLALESLKYAEAIKLYEETGVEQFPNLVQNFGNAIRVFAEDPKGLDAYIKYISTTSDKLDKQDRTVKKIRDDSFVRGGIMTAKRASKKQARREKEAKNEDRRALAIRLVDILSQSDVKDAEAIKIAKQLGVAAQLPAIAKASKSNGASAIISMVLVMNRNKTAIP